MNSHESVQIHRQREAVDLLISALGQLSVPPKELKKLHDQISSSPELILIRDMGLDSLGTMEFCIHLEVDAGVVISPEELIGVDHAGQLISLIDALM